MIVLIPGELPFITYDSSHIPGELPVITYQGSRNLVFGD